MRTLKIIIPYGLIVIMWCSTRTVIVWSIYNLCKVSRIE